MIGAGTLVWDGGPSWKGVPGLGVAQRRYAYAQPVPVLPMISNVASVQHLARTSRLDPPRPHAP